LTSGCGFGQSLLIFIDIEVVAQAATGRYEKDLPMTTSNTSSNDNADTPDKEETTSGRGSRSSGRAKRQPKEAGLVKAEIDHSSIIVLSDNTRLVETDSLPNHRPIALSNFEVVDWVGGRPIAANTFQISTIDTLPGHRPIAVSDLPVADLHVLPGDRPIAPNDLVDPPASVLMGYLD